MTNEAPLKSQSESEKQNQIKTEPRSGKNKKSSEKPKKSSSSSAAISAIALLIALGSTGFLGYETYLKHDQNQQETAIAADLKTQFTQLQTQTQAEMKQWQAQANAQEAKMLNSMQTQENKTQTALNGLEQTISAQKLEIAQLKDQANALQNALQKVNASRGEWQIAQVDYLVNLASRKIWADGDYKTAYRLLKDADAILAQQQDQQWIPIRKAIAEDLNQIASRSFVDEDGLVLTLMRLSDGVDQLPLIQGYQNLNVNLQDDSFQSEAPEVSDSVKDWKANLSQSLDHFVTRLISVKKIETRNDLDRCLTAAQSDPEALKACQIYKAPLSPEQATYLRENMRLKLLIAAQAVQRSSDSVYQMALSEVNDWVHAYFVTESSAVIDFMTELNALRAVNVAQQNDHFQLKAISALDATTKQTAQE